MPVVSQEGDRTHAEGEQRAPGAHGVRLAEPLHDASHETAADDDGDGTREGEDEAHVRRRHREHALRVEGENGGHRREAGDREEVDEEQDAQREALERAQPCADGRGLSLRGVGASRAEVPRLGQQRDRRQQVHQTQPGGDVAGHAEAEAAEVPADRGPKHDAETGRRADEAETAGALLALRGVGDVRLRDAERASGCPGRRTRHEEEPQIVGEGEEEVRERRREESDEEETAAADAVGEPSPHRRGQELRDRERGDDERDPARRGTQILRVERKQREDDAEAHHVHHHRPEQDAEPGASQHAVVVVVPCLKPILSLLESAPRAAAGSAGRRRFATGS